MNAQKLTQDERVEIIFMCGRLGASNSSVALKFNENYPNRALIDTKDCWKITPTIQNQWKCSWQQAHKKTKSSTDVVVSSSSVLDTTKKSKEVDKKIIFGNRSPKKKRPANTPC